MLSLPAEDGLQVGWPVWRYGAVSGTETWNAWPAHHKPLLSPFGPFSINPQLYQKETPTRAQALQLLTAMDAMHQLLVSGAASE